MTPEQISKALDLGYSKLWLWKAIQADLGLPVQIHQDFILWRDWLFYKDQSPWDKARQDFLNQVSLVKIWGDGSGTVGTKDAGIGVFLEYFVQDKVFETQELSAYIGLGTSNKAELTAIYQGLRCVPKLNTPIMVHSDSQYALGMSFNPNWIANKNVKLIETIRKNIRYRNDIHYEHVKGHSGILQNEICDKLAKKGRLHGKSA